MKRTILFFAILLQATFLLAQGSLQLFDHDNNEFINGQNHEVMVDFVEWETISPELFVKNISTSDISIKIRVEEVSIPEGTGNYFCGLGNCFAPGTMETPNPYAISAGQLIGSEGVFSAHYQANGIEGNAVMRYTYFNVDNLNDTISVTFTFNGTVVAEPSLQLFDHDNVEFVNGQNHVVTVDFAEWETISPELFAKNISANDINIKIRVEEVSVPEGSSNYFCGLGSCFAPGTMETPDPWPISAGQLIGSEGVFSAHYQNNGVFGDAVVRYTFFNTDNLNDTISVTFTFDGTPSTESLQLFDHDNVEIENEGIITVDVVDLGAVEVVSPELFIKNNSDHAISLRCKREQVDIVDGSVNYFCALGVCLIPEGDETTREYILEAGEIAPSIDPFSSHYTPNGNPGTSTLRYTFYDIDNVSDSLSFSVVFTDVSGIDNIGDDFALAAYPNPARDLVFIDLNELDLNEGSIEIYNALGELSFVKTFIGESTLKLNLESLPRGVYLYRIVSKASYSSTSKLILK